MTKKFSDRDFRRRVMQVLGLPDTPTSAGKALTICRKIQRTLKALDILEERINRQKLVNTLEAILKKKVKQVFTTDTLALASGTTYAQQVLLRDAFRKTYPPVDLQGNTIRVSGNITLMDDLIKLTPTIGTTEV